jgi:hypothetical protein
VNILIKNIPSTDLQRLKGKMPTANLSLIIRALIAHALTLTDEQFTRIVNKQASHEQKASNE